MPHPASSGGAFVNTTENSNKDAMQQMASPVTYNNERPLSGQEIGRAPIYPINP